MISSAKFWIFLWWSYYSFLFYLFPFTNLPVSNNATMIFFLIRYRQILSFLSFLSLTIFSVGWYPQCKVPRCFREHIETLCFVYIYFPFYNVASSNYAITVYIKSVIYSSTVGLSTNVFSIRTQRNQFPNVFVSLDRYFWKSVFKTLYFSRYVKNVKPYRYNLKISIGYFRLLFVCKF
jgi:hypothetical protein